MKKSICCALLALLSLSISTASAQEEPEVRAPREGDGSLAWKFEEGQVIKMKMVQDVSMATSAGAMNMEMSNGATNEMTMVVKSVDSSGVATVGNTIDRMVVKSEAPGMSFEIDTNDKDDYDGIEAQVANTLGPMVGVEISQKMSPDGKIFDVEVPSSMFEGIDASNPMAAMFNEDTIKETTSKASLVFPDEPPTVGTSWVNKAEMNMGGAVVNTETNYEYLGVSDSSGKPLHVIKGNLKMSFPDGIQGMDVDLSDEDSSFLFYFDGNAGRLEKSVLDQNVTLNINAQGQSISQEISQTMTLTYTLDK